LNNPTPSSSGLTGVVASPKNLLSNLKYLVEFIENLTKLHSLVTLGFIPGVHKALKTLIFWIAGMVAGKENNPVNCFP
jgi:hypothetical protein